MDDLGTILLEYDRLYWRQRKQRRLHQIERCRGKPVRPMRRIHFAHALRMAQLMAADHPMQDLVPIQ